MRKGRRFFEFACLVISLFLFYGCDSNKPDPQSNRATPAAENSRDLSSLSDAELDALIAERRIF